MVKKRVKRAAALALAVAMTMGALPASLPVWFLTTKFLVVRAVPI